MQGSALTQRQYNASLDPTKVRVIGAQSAYGIAGFWEVFQFMVPPYDDYTHLSQWNLWHSDPNGVNRLPERTLAVDMMFSTDLAAEASGEKCFALMESFWDKEATLLADKMVMRGIGTKDAAGFVRPGLSARHTLFCPITGSSSYGDGASGPASSADYTLRQITVRLTKQLKGKLVGFSDFEMQRIYLPSDNDDFLDKT